MAGDSARQPFLHDLTTVLAAPTQVLSRPDGDIDGGAQAVLHADVRVLSTVRVLVGGHTPEHINTVAGTTEARFTALLRRVEADPATPDPTLRLDRTRRVEPGRVSESLLITSVLDHAVQTEVTVEIGADLLGIEMIKSGRLGARVEMAVADPETVDWADDQVRARLRAPGATVSAGDGGLLRLSWPVTVGARGSVQLGWRLELQDQGAVVGPAAAGGLSVDRLVPELMGRALENGHHDSRLEGWIRRSLEDLNALRMTRVDQPDEPFFAAGSPWYLTLFGRDSLWAARLLLPVDREHALTTLRALARLQGTTVDPVTGEAPGKIMHELRRGAFSPDSSQTSLPPLYYGTIDATPLWVCLLHDLWRAGLPAEHLVELVPTMIEALEWLVRYADSDGDGFLEYLDESGRGLANQGWKDSADSVRFADGSIAVGPVALCEVQGYAYEAAMAGAAILDHLGRPGADRYRGWATALADRFRAEFWTERDGRRFPALALDGEKRLVDSVTSNIGHLLGTGLLSPDEELLVAARVSAPDLDSGLGLRTMGSDDGGYAPLSYHCGSVWPHDTAIVVAGLVRAGRAEYAQGLVDGLLRAADHFDGRFPELWSGEGVAGVPYPAACRPQAWSAAAVVSVVTALEALRTDQP